MRTRNPAFRTFLYLLIAATMVFTLAACGGGGGGGTSSTSPGVAGPAALSVAVGSATSYPAGTTFAPSTLSPETAVPQNSPSFDNVFVWVNKVALIPASGVEYPDANGELEQADSSAENGKSGIQGFVTIPLEKPVRIDLLNPPSGRKLAYLLNKFSEAPVPAGEYSKIRVYYDNVVGYNIQAQSETVFHQTAHYHFDVHFVGGNLVIPESAPMIPEGAPQEGIRFYSVVINVVGLKYHQAGASSNVLLRPQVFARFVPPVLYSVTGTADNVEKNFAPDSVSGAFDVAFATGTPVQATFDNNTSWAYSDDVLAWSSWKILAVPNRRAADAFNNRAVVKVIGWFDGGIFRGTDILFTFPDVRDGVADNVWIPPDNVAFIVRSADNVVVYPMPDPETAYYDNLANPGSWTAGNPPPYPPLVDNAPVRVRGYFDGPDLSAYWISIDAVAP